MLSRFGIYLGLVWNTRTSSRAVTSTATTGPRPNRRITSAGTVFSTLPSTSCTSGSPTLSPRATSPTSCSRLSGPWTVTRRRPLSTPFEFHAEGAAKFVESHGRDDRFQWVAGLNYTFDELPVKWLERIETILEYSQENILDKRRHSEYGAAIGFFSLAFRNALTGRLRFKFSEETSFAVSGTANFESAEPGHYLQLKLTRKLTDAFHVEGGFDLIDGPTHTVWGQWRRNDRAFVLLKYFF